MSHPPLAPIATLYGVPESALHPLRGGHSAHTYGFSQGGSEYVLRLTPPDDEIDVTAQRAILAWMHFLATHGATVPEPIASQNGQFIEVIPHEDGQYLAVVFTRAKGVLSEELSLDQWDDNLYDALGRAIGRMHAIARGYVPTEGLRRPDWDVASSLFNRPRLSESWLAPKQAPILKHLQSLPRTAEGYGLIHADLHFGNFFVDVPSRIITILDFDDCCYGWYAMDLAMLLFDVLVLYVGQERDAFARRFMRNLLKGYRAENTLDAFWLDQLPYFCKLLEIDIYDEVQPYYAAQDTDWWGNKFMPGRRERIENDVPYIDFTLAS